MTSTVNKALGRWAQGRKSSRARTMAQAGLDLIQLVLVLIIIGIVIGLVINQFQKAQFSQRMTQSQQLVATLKSKIQSVYRQDGDYGSEEDGDMLTLLISTDAFPSGVLRANLPYHPWNGRIVVGGETQQFYIEYQDVPVAACIELARMMGGGTGQQTDLVSIQVGSTDVTTVNVVAIEAACAGGGAAAKQDVRWTFF